MKKMICLCAMLVLFTGCAASQTQSVDYDNPSSIQEGNYASYEDWVEDELDMMNYYANWSEEDMDQARQIAMQDQEYFREVVRQFNEQVEYNVQQQQQQFDQQMDMAQQQQQQMFDQQVQMSTGF